LKTIATAASFQPWWTSLLSSFDVS
jgi:hypothetical protein